VSFVLNDQTINANISKATTKAYHSRDLRTYLRDQHNWSNVQIDSIWWKAHHKSISRSQTNDQTRIQKFIHNYLPTNSRLQVFDNDHPDRCPCCNQIETTNHVLRCKSETRQPIRDNWITALNNFLSRTHTSDDLKKCIMTNTIAWLNDKPLPNHTSDLE
jgi:hypothetical protein